MDPITATYYNVDNKLFKCSLINFQFNNLEYQVYEVFRVSNKIPIFLNDHLKRLNDSLAKLHISKYFDEKYAKKIILDLLESNDYPDGNIKFLFRYDKGLSSYASYYIPHNYPNELDYKNGVKLVTYSIIRRDPQIKQVVVNEFVKKKIEKIKVSTKAYEILLVNQMDCITEGSKSNIFMIRDNIVFSPPDAWILKGITRKYVIDICNNLNLNYKEIKIITRELNEFEAAFICGTSPKILPVREINGIFFDVKHPMIQIIKNQYDELFKKQMISKLY